MVVAALTRGVWIATQKPEVFPVHQSGLTAATEKATPEAADDRPLWTNHGRMAAARTIVALVVTYAASGTGSSPGKDVLAATEVEPQCNWHRRARMAYVPVAQPRTPGRRDSQTLSGDTCGKKATCETQHPTSPNRLHRRCAARSQQPVTRRVRHHEPSISAAERHARVLPARR